MRRNKWYVLSPKECNHPQIFSDVIIQPGFWFDAKSTRSENVEKAFKRAVKSALKSGPQERANMRAVLARLRYPLVVWTAEMDEVFAIIAEQYSQEV